MALPPTMPPLYKNTVPRLYKNTVASSQGINAHGATPHHAAMNMEDVHLEQADAPSKAAKKGQDPQDSNSNDGKTLTVHVEKKASGKSTKAAHLHTKNDKDPPSYLNESFVLLEVVHYHNNIAYISNLYQYLYHHQILSYKDILKSFLTSHLSEI